MNRNVPSKSTYMHLSQYMYRDLSMVVTVEDHPMFTADGLRWLNIINTMHFASALQASTLYYYTLQAHEHTFIYHIHIYFCRREKYIFTANFISRNLVLSQ